MTLTILLVYASLIGCGVWIPWLAEAWGVKGL